MRRLFDPTVPQKYNASIIINFCGAGLLSVFGVSQLMLAIASTAPHSSWSSRSPAPQAPGYRTAEQTFLLQELG